MFREIGKGLWPPESPAVAREALGMCPCRG
jgi:hypothetical protein